METFRFLNGRSRVISLGDYNVEKRLVLAVPHQMRLGEPEELAPEVAQRVRSDHKRRRKYFLRRSSLFNMSNAEVSGITVLGSSSAGINANGGISAAPD